MLSFDMYKAVVNYIFAVLTIIFFYPTAFAQNNDRNNSVLPIEDIVSLRPNDYKTIDRWLNTFSNDSIIMKQFRTQSKNADYDLGETYALNALGTIYRNMSHYEKSIKYHKLAHAKAKLAQNVEFTVSSLNYIGVSYRRMDEIKPALDHHFEAMEIALSVENPTEIIKYNIAVSQNSLGNIYLVLDQNDLAIKYFKKSLLIEKEMGNRLGLAINYQNIGLAYEARGNLDLAVANYRRSLDYNEQIGSDIGRIICYNSIGKILIKQEKFEDAEVILKNALEKSLSTEDKFYTSQSYNNLGWVQTKLKQYDQAEQNLLAGLDLSKSYNLKSTEVSSLKLLSDLYIEMKDFEKALDYYTNSINLGDTIINDTNLKYVNDVIVQFENDVKIRQIESLALENEAVRERLRRNQIIFWLALVGLLATTIVLLIISKNRRLNQDKLILTLEQDMLRNQMNPHFIFNTLNSIKLYIINNEKENAVYYLNKFSKLIRKILLSSTEKIISLKDEIETMQLYMNIENIRFSNEIDFNIEVEDDIDASAIKVPPLILQPFLENALWHGLSTIEYEKKIWLHVSKDSDQYVNITITDNGIGRKRSEEINKEKRLTKKSLGLDITKARLTNFSENFTQDYQLEFMDLHDDREDKVGTKIILKIPIRSNVLKTA